MKSTMKSVMQDAQFTIGSHNFIEVFIKICATGEYNSKGVRIKQQVMGKLSASVRFKQRSKCLLGFLKGKTGKFHTEPIACYSNFIDRVNTNLFIFTSNCK